jgi:disulfide bond formation protein DsbB
VLKANFLIVLAGILGSLYFSEVLGFPPCILCWYQRICLYPLGAIFAVAIWTDDIGYKKYALPLAVMGLVIACYHNLLYFGVLDEALSPCTKDLSCTTKQLELFGFLTIPLLSMIGFVLSTLLIAMDRTSLRSRS